MRSFWDSAEQRSRQAVLDAGVEINSVDHAAFARATAPLLQRRLQAPGLRRLYDEIRSMA
jgi:TRAP-type C4-dicarboxylate transport system substrate-binding protein